MYFGFTLRDCPDFFYVIYEKCQDFFCFRSGIVRSVSVLFRRCQEYFCFLSVDRKDYFCFIRGSCQDYLFVIFGILFRLFMFYFSGFSEFLRFYFRGLSCLLFFLFQGIVRTYLGLSSYRSHPTMWISAIPQVTTHQKYSTIKICAG